LHQNGQTVNNDNLGAWNDAIDTNVSGSSTLTFTRQWQRADDVGGSTGFTNLLDQTNATYAISASDTGKFMRVQVTCTDDGVGTGGPLGVTTNSIWILVTGANSLPVITNGNGTLVVNLTEDGGATNLLTVLNLGATDADSGQQDTLEWTNMTVSAYGTMSVSGTGSNPAAISYTPNANWNGTNTFTVRVTDTVGGFDEIPIEVHVAAVNDAPVCTVTQVVSGARLVGQTLSVNTGTWNDGIDTNVSGSSTLTFTYQWQRAGDSGGGGLANIPGATSSSYTLVHDDKYQYLRTAVTCTDDGVGTGGNQSNTAYSSWLQETSTVPTTVTFTNALANGAWGSYSNWAPDTVPQAGITTVIGDVNVKSPVTAIIGASDAAVTKDLTLGNNAGASGSLSMTGGTLTGNGNVTVGSAAGSTGVVEMTGGTITNISALSVGSAGYGQMAVGGTGVVSASTVTLGASAGGYGNLMVGGTGVVKTTTLNVGSAGQGYLYMSNNTYMDVRDLYLGGAAGSNAYMEVADNAFITNSGSALYGIQMGLAAGNVSILQLKGGSLITRTANGGGMSGIGHAVGSTGIVTVTGGSHVLACGATSPGQDQYVGAATGSLGRIEVKGGNLAMTACWVIGRYGRGELLISGGGFTKPSGGSTEYLYLGGDRGGYGLIGVTGGTWNQAAPLYVGVIAGGTGEVSVANCVSTNITGAVTVGGGTTPGDRYGSVTISNATFGGGTAVSVLTNGFVELTGIGSVLRVNTLTVNGGQVTNHVQGLSGGVDVTNSALTSLVVTNGARMHLVFQRPSLVGAYWGLKWAGNRATQLQGMTNSGALSWDASQAGGVVEIFTNATHTMVGYVVDQAGTTFRFR
jgi:hypothetical protein